MILRYVLFAITVHISLSLSGQTVPPKGALGATKESSDKQPPPKGLVRMSKDQRDALLRADHRILLNVVVNDVSGKPVSGLGQDDFTLFDHHEPRAISSFQVVNGNSTTGRAHILLLIDSLNCSLKR